jgi:hypothetical protein
MAWIERQIARWFKIYFILCLLGFVAAILLMNLPRVLAADISQLAGAPRSSPAAANKSAGGGVANLKKLLSVKVSEDKADELTGAGQFVEYTGTKLSFVIRF